jgi:uncharacterized protein (TIGR03083 family)
METQTISVSSIPALTRDEAMDLAATEYARTITALRALTPEEWTRPTECAGWDVRAMASHTLGSAEAHASFREFVHQARSARKAEGSFVDGLTATQVRDRAAVPPAEIVRRLEVAAPASVKARRRMPGVFRSRHITVDMPSGAIEKWEIAFLMDTIFTRDAWMHRGDIARATCRELVLTPDHDGRIVADAVADWARRHGQPFRLVLEGPAGGEFVQGNNGDEQRLDAVEFCRVLSGRGQGEGLLTQEVPF